MVDLRNYPVPDKFQIRWKIYFDGVPNSDMTKNIPAAEEIKNYLSLECEYCAFSCDINQVVGQYLFRKSIV